MYIRLSIYRNVCVYYLFPFEEKLRVVLACYARGAGVGAVTLFIDVGGNSVGLRV